MKKDYLKVLAMSMFVVVVCLLITEFNKSEQLYLKAFQQCIELTRDAYYCGDSVNKVFTK